MVTWVTLLLTHLDLMVVPILRSNWIQFLLRIGTTIRSSYF